MVWSIVATTFKCLADEINESVENPSYRDYDDHAMDFTNYSEISQFSTHLITESRLSTEPHKRVKRVHVFRPLFVYRQEQIKRKRIFEKRKERSQQNKQNHLPDKSQKPQPCMCCNQCHRY